MVAKDLQDNFARIFSVRGARGKFIVLEGPDKSGKSTHARFLVRRLRAAGIPTVHTREPGGTSFAEAIRELVLKPTRQVHPLAELLLYEAARAQHTQELLSPALRAGKTVICERYTLATLAYQGCGRSLPIPLIRRLNRVATYGLEPDLTLVIDIPDQEFLRRPRAGGRDRLEREDSRFRAKVREGYLRLSRSEPRTRLVRGDLEPHAVRAEILRQVRRLLLKSGL